MDQAEKLWAKKKMDHDRYIEAIDKKSLSRLVSPKYKAYKRKY
jgi:hypothetical protein